MRLLWDEPAFSSVANGLEACAFTSLLLPANVIESTGQQLVLEDIALRDAGGLLGEGASLRGTFLSGHSNAQLAPTTAPRCVAGKSWARSDPSEPAAYSISPML